MRYLDYLCPLTALRMDILSELYKSPLRMKSISEKIGKSIASTNNSIKKMKEILVRREGVYSIREDVEVFLKDLLVRYILEKSMGKFFDFLYVIKKNVEVKEIIVFGSYYKGLNKEGSDFDLYVVANMGDDVKKRLKEMFFRIYKVELDLKVVSPEIHLTKEDNLSDLYSNIVGNKEQGIKVPLEMVC